MFLKYKLYKWYVFKQNKLILDLKSINIMYDRIESDQENTGIKKPASKAG